MPRFTDAAELWLRDGIVRAMNAHNGKYMLKLGIVGLPNVGKSTLFNALTSAQAEAANYPFCTVEPNVGIVEVPDARLAGLAERGEPEAHRAGGRGVRRHRRAREGRGERRRTRQQVSREHPRDGRDHPRRALLRGSGRAARDGRDRSRARPRSDRDRARARGSRDGGETARQGAARGEVARQGGARRAARSRGGVRDAERRARALGGDVRATSSVQCSRRCRCLRRSPCSTRRT